MMHACIVAGRIEDVLEYNQFKLKMKADTLTVGARFS
jgi:hypothetical protein